MKRRMMLNEVKDFYKTNDIMEGEGCFEYVSEKLTAVTFELPLEFQVIRNGGVIDPIKLLKVPHSIWHLTFDELFMFTPLEMSYICGYCSVSGEKQEVVRFRPGDPMENPKEMNAVIIKAHWDTCEDVSDLNWGEAMRERYDGKIVCSLRETDCYGVAGDWYWLIKIDDFLDSTVFGLAVLLMQYVYTLRPVYLSANNVLERFETEKDGYRERMVKCLEGLHGRIHWIVAAEEEELWPKYDANRELWEKEEYDWQIIQFDECLEIRYRGGSPGAIAVERPRCDAIGLQICQNLLT